MKLLFLGLLLLNACATYVTSDELSDIKQRMWSLEQRDNNIDARFDEVDDRVTILKADLDEVIQDTSAIRKQSKPTAVIKQAPILKKKKKR